MKRTISLLLALVMVFNLAACIRVPGKKDETPAITAEPVAEATAAPTAEPTPEPTAEPTAEPTEEPTPEPTATPEPLPPENWADIDRDFFKEYMSSDLTTLHQMVKDPSVYGIDYDEVERSLGTYKEDPDREWYLFVEDLVSRMDRVELDKLTDQEKLAYDTLRQFCELELEGEEFYGYYEPLVPTTGVQGDIPLVFWFYELNNKQDVADSLTLLADLPRYFGELLEYEQYRAEKLNIFMIETNLNKVLEDIDGILEARETNFLYTTFREALAKVDGLTEEEIKAYEERNDALLNNEYYQAYADLRAGLDALRPYCREALGVKATGDEKYLRWFAYQLKQSTDENLDPKEVCTLLFDSFSKSVDVIMDAYRHDGDAVEEGSVGTVEENIAYLKEQLDPLLPPLPEVNVTYEEVSEELQDVVSPAFYLIASFDDWQNNIIGLNQPEEAPNLISTLAHEGFNGHLYQYVYHRSMPGLSLTQQVLEGTAYAEAWSQYSERLFAYNCGPNFNTYDLRVEHFSNIAWYALIFYFSIRVNYFGDKFIDVYRTYSRNFNTKNQNEFRRTIYEPYIIGHPFYGMPYAYGYARLIDLHDIAQSTLGSKYDQKAFDAQYLSYGPSYFNLLADRLDQWAKEQ